MALRFCARTSVAGLAGARPGAGTEEEDAVLVGSFCSLMGGGSGRGETGRTTWAVAVVTRAWQPSQVPDFLGEMDGSHPSRRGGQGLGPGSAPRYGLQVPASSAQQGAFPCWPDGLRPVWRDASMRRCSPWSRPSTLSAIATRSAEAVASDWPGRPRGVRGGDAGGSGVRSDHRRDADRHPRSAGGAGAAGGQARGGGEAIHAGLGGGVTVGGAGP